MENLIAKRYAKAIALRADIDEFYENLCVLSSAFLSPKFKSIIESIQIKKEKKIELLDSFFEKKNINFQNFLKILVQNSRLGYIPQIAKEIQKQKSFKENTFLGVVYSKEILNQTELNNLEFKLNRKFNANIKLNNQINKDDSVKIKLEELGYELSFSMRTLQNKLNEHILKII